MNLKHNINYIYKNIKKVKFKKGLIMEIIFCLIYQLLIK